ncbi:MAG: hypothetical protein OXI77_18190 [Chloroflexota bacterium]|nr:hypothetical protein [Chloroflexota bacterium]MDE2908317.1 hypothetical protein [Chloroflexota bacterium]
MARREVILTDKAPVPTSGYSQALRRGGLVVTSGYLGTAPDGAGLVAGGGACDLCSAPSFTTSRLSYDVNPEWRISCC